MKVFLDTNVLVAAVAKEHGDHGRCHPLLARVQEGRNSGFMSAHGIAEVYAILTSLPAPLKHSPEQARFSLEQNILNYFKVVSLTGADYAALVGDAALAGVRGGTVYDALLLKCAEKSGAERIYTMNLRHFRAVASKDLLSKIAEP